MSTQTPAELLDDPTPPDPRAEGLFASIRRVLPAGEVIRFLIVGASNTLISFLIYAAFVRFYTVLMPAHKLLLTDAASITSKPIAITIAFLCYKHFVFRTKGNYLKEYIRCFAVYGVSTPAELLILPAATKVLQLFALTHTHAPTLAGLVSAVLIASYSYFAHKKFSFKR